MGILSEIGSLVTTTATGGMSIVTKYMAEIGVVMVLVVGAGLWGYHLGSLAEKNAVLAATNKAAAKVVTITKVETVIDTNAVSKLQKQLDIAKGKDAHLQAQLKALKESQLTVIKGTGINATCELSPDWLSIYNGSLKP